MPFNLAKRMAQKINTIEFSKKEDSKDAPLENDQSDIVEKVEDAKENDIDEKGVDTEGQDSDPDSDSKNDTCDDTSDTQDRDDGDNDGDDVMDADDIDNEIIDLDSAPIAGGGLLNILEHIKQILGNALTKGDSIITEKLEPKKVTETSFSNPFEILSDDDFDGDDETVKTFKNDFDGCKGMVRIIKINDPNAQMKLSSVITTLRAIREASRTRDLRMAFSEISAASKSSNGLENQVRAMNLLKRLSRDSNSREERKTLLAAHKSVLAGTSNHLDAAAFRVRSVFSSVVPTRNLRVAYTTLRQPVQGEPVQQCPKALYQMGRAEMMPVSICRDQCIDSRVQKDGRIACAYSDWTRLADNHEKAMSRLDSIRHPDNAANLLTLKKGERAKLPTDAQRSIEQRMEEDLKTRGKDPSDKSMESQLEDGMYGHKGDKENNSIFALNRTAAKKVIEIDPSSKDTLGKQIEKGHAEKGKFGTQTIEEMLEDEHVGLSEGDIDKILEEWLDENRTELRKEAKSLLK